MDTALPHKFPFILDRNLAKANCTWNRVCTSCDTAVLDYNHRLTTNILHHSYYQWERTNKERNQLLEQNGYQKYVRDICVRIY